MTKLKQYKLDQKTIAKYFGYYNTNSFKSSTAKKRIINGILAIINHIECLPED